MTPDDRIRLPVLGAPPQRPGIPIVAALAPVVIAVVIWMFTSSPYVLLFAALGPVVAVAGYLDARRTARRSRSREIDEVRRRMEDAAARIDERAQLRRAALDAVAPEPSVRMTAAFDGVLTPLRLGVGHLPVDPALDGAEDVAPELAEQVGALVRRAGVLGDAPIVRDDDDYALTGPRVLTRAFARALAVQLAARLPLDAVVRAPDGEAWVEQLPQRSTIGEGWEFAMATRTIRIHEHHGAPGTPIRLDDLRLPPPGSRAAADGGAWRPLLLPAVAARVVATRLAEGARAGGWRPQAEPPEHVELEQLIARAGERSAFAAPIGCDATGPVYLDLVADGPHALVAGTTGSGKSELLVAWVLALASAVPPEQLAVLFIDFKGGAAAVPLAALPHLVGVVSDLEPATASRAVESLRAEVRRRERRLAEERVRAIDELPVADLPRLLVVVDEYAALVATSPDLATVFADIAARGRTLGMHLLLCTQRPTGVVRDAVLANVTLRVCLRVLDPHDSTAVIGSPLAAEISPERRGRAMLRDGGGARPIQLAIAAEGAAGRVAARWSGHGVPAARPWIDPLPALIRAEEMPESTDEGAIVIGVADVPAEQSRIDVVVRPWAAGGFVVAGGAGSGRTTTLRTLCLRSRGAEVRRVESGAELWAALETPPADRSVLVVVDDLDRVLARLDPEHAAELAERIARACGESRTSRLTVAAATASLTGAAGRAIGGVDQRVLLRTARRDEHVMLGGDPHLFDPDRLPGGGQWRAHELRVGFTAVEPVAPWVQRIAAVPLPGAVPAIATPRPAAVIAALQAAGIGTGGPGSGERVEVAEPDAWLAEHHALVRHRRDGGILLLDCSPAEHRALSRERALPPPLASRHEAWRCVDGETRRVRVVWPAGQA